LSQAAAPADARVGEKAFMNQSSQMEVLRVGTTLAPTVGWIQCSFAPVRQDAGGSFFSLKSRAVIRKKW
jgi:hypothetical protein